MDNQTEELWLLNASASDTGTGLFVFPSSNSDDFGATDWDKNINSEVYGPMKKALLADITYLDCVGRGMKDGVTAFKWIPSSLATLDDVKKSASSCGSVICVKRCAKYGCACTAGECK